MSAKEFQKLAWAYREMILFQGLLTGVVDNILSRPHDAIIAAAFTAKTLAHTHPCEADQFCEALVARAGAKKPPEETDL